jgi:class 3 adenylate cyclase
LESLTEISRDAHVNAIWSLACRGVVVDIGNGVAALAKPGEVLVTRTVVDLVAGSGLRFADRGMHTLAKGQKGWRVYAVRQG